MTIALAEALKSDCDLPIGCVIINEKKEVVAKAHNLVEKENLLTKHAEMVAIENACLKLKQKRLENHMMFVTLEPCPMCAWLIIQTNIKHLVFGAYDLQYGAFGSKEDFRRIFNRSLKVTGGVLEDSCSKLLHDYFRVLRKK